MDELDNALIGALRHDARASLSDLAARLGLSRATVRARMQRLQRDGDILGYSVVLKGDIAQDPVRALMMIEMEGGGIERVIRRLQGMSETRALHTTNGRWDLVVELGTPTLEALDTVLNQIRRYEGVQRSETNLLLTTRKSGALSARG
ncbi:MAG: Lrp/AsnC family transcriptional regulator [Rhodobacteraceae bacterium]|nr:Lrp/AsnC family transcriptional regulator [Paracoccaceae bacterium]